MQHSATELTIVHRDPAFLVVDKPGGLLAVPGRGVDKQDCVAARIRSICPQMLDQPAVHRLDMYTSGLMLLAVTPEAHRILSRQFAERQVDKRYIALLEGTLSESIGEIQLCFRLDPDNRPYQIHDPLQGKLGITRWRRLSLEGRRTRIEFTPLTGRTHQLRLHAAHHLGLGIPIVGDRLYGLGREGEQMLLHAAFLAFTHPCSGAALQFHSPPPF